MDFHCFFKGSLYTTIPAYYYVPPPLGGAPTKICNVTRSFTNSVLNLMKRNGNNRRPDIIILKQNHKIYDIIFIIIIVIIYILYIFIYCDKRRLFLPVKITNIQIFIHMQYTVLASTASTVCVLRLWLEIHK